jgi:molybdate transport system substrate-binding protein
MRLPKWLALSTLSLLALTFALLGGRSAGAAEIRLFSSAALNSIVDSLEPQFQKASGNTIARTVDVAAALKRRIDAGEAFDVAMLNPNHIDDLAKAGKVDAASRVNFARAGIGVGVRTGAAKPNIATVEAFKQTLLKAKSVAYSKEGASGVHFVSMLARLGIADEMKPKLRPTGAGFTALAVAKGEAEMVVVNVAPILAAAGVDFVGMVPTELQAWVSFTAGVSSASKQPEASRALVQYLTTPQAASIIKARGMEPLAQQ